MSSSTLPAQKQTFLTSQIHLLTTPLVLPPSTSSSLPPTVTAPLLATINKRLKSHNRSVYALQSQHHVTEQISGIYWRDVLASGLPVLTDLDTTIVSRDVNLTDSTDVKTLAGEWNDVTLHPQPRPERGRGVKRKRAQGHEGQEQDHSVPHSDDHTDDENTDPQLQPTPPTNNHHSLATHYVSLHRSLQRKTSLRDALALKCKQYTALHTLLQPLQNPKVDIQHNLVTKDNTALDAEMRRLRVLVARVENGLGKLQGGEGLGVEGEQGEDIEQIGQGERCDGSGLEQIESEKVQALLGLG